MISCKQESCTFQAICCICEKRYGPAAKPDDSHGYCYKHAVEMVDKMEFDGEERENLLSTYEEQDGNLL